MPPKFTKCTFHGQPMVLDGQDFYDCEFEKCQLIYNGGPLPTLNGCTFKHSTFLLGEAAQRTQEYIRALYMAGAKDIVRDWFPELLVNPENN